MNQKNNKSNLRNPDYINNDKKYSDTGTAIQKKVRITGSLIVFTFLFIFTIAFIFIISNFII